MRERLWPDLRAVLPSWVAARVLVALAYPLAGAVVRHWSPLDQSRAMSDGLIAWDGTFYVDIAELGYQADRLDATRFFPLYPLAGRVLSLGTSSTVALVVVANLAALAAAVALRRLVLIERDDDALADRAVWALNLFPAAFVLVWAYSEALFLLLSILCFTQLRRHRPNFAAAGLLAAAAALTRPVGVVLALPIAIEAVRTWRDVGWRGGDGRVARVVAVGLPALGLGSFLAWVGWRFDDPWAPVDIQGELRGSSDPISRLVQGVVDLFGDERFGDGLHLPFALALVALLVVAVRRWPVSYSAYAAVLMLLALSADNLNSLERYGLAAFPLLLAIAEVTATPRRERVALAVCGCGLLSLCTLAWMGAYVP